MSDFDPGEGWREVSIQEYTRAYQGKRGRVTYTGDGGTTTTYWVREEPVPLPTEPYTVIRATWKPGAVRETYVLAYSLRKWTNVNNGIQHTPEELLGGITGFEVLASPAGAQFLADEVDRMRRETAKAVLDRVEALSEVAPFTRNAILHREFGVGVDR